MACDSYNILSICSGVGGLDLAVGLAVENAFTVCHVEREAQAAAVLATRMEDGSLHEAPVWSDLSTFDGKPWRGSVYRRAWQTLCGETLEKSFQRGSVRLLQNDVYSEAFAPEDLLALLRQQAGMGKKKIKTDRLRASGNGVCSMAGAIAWLSLANHFEELEE